MDAVSGMCLADRYTDDPAKVPDRVWQEVQRILSILFEREGIEYVDVTSYNFMEDDDGKVWIIDFGDAFYTKGGGKEAQNWFLRSVLSGDSGKAWNPDFA